MPVNPYRLEICAYDAASAVVAAEAGAHRIELCADPAAGGTTPSYGTIALAREQLRVPLHVIIRPRGGDYLYSDAEIAVMMRDIVVCKNLGVDGVVIGVLLPEGLIDVARTRELVDTANPMSATFHRAFDMTEHPVRALEDVIEVGCQRLLTSGQADAAIDGVSLLAKLVQNARARITIMPGAGVRSTNLKALLSNTGANEFHSSARMVAQSGMRFRNASVNIGNRNNSYEYGSTTVDRMEIKRMCNILGKAGSNG